MANRFNNASGDGHFIKYEIPSIIPRPSDDDDEQVMCESDGFTASCPPDVPIVPGPELTASLSAEQESLDSPSPRSYSGGGSNAYSAIKKMNTMSCQP